CVVKLPYVWRTTRAGSSATTPPPVGTPRGNDRAGPTTAQSHHRPTGPSASHSWDHRRNAQYSSAPTPRPAHSHRCRGNDSAHHHGKAQTPPTPDGRRSPPPQTHGW